LFCVGQIDPDGAGRFRGRSDRGAIMWHGAESAVATTAPRPACWDSRGRFPSVNSHWLAGGSSNSRTLKGGGAAHNLRRRQRSRKCRRVRPAAPHVRAEPDFGHARFAIIRSQRCRDSHVVPVGMIMSAPSGRSSVSAPLLTDARKGLQPLEDATSTDSDRRDGFDLQLLRPGAINRTSSESRGTLGQSPEAEGPRKSSLP
jgi:hypothetical protein